MGAPERRSRSWELSLFEHRKWIHETLIDSASVAVRWNEALTRTYEVARVRAARETNLPLRDFPMLCPYDRAEIMEAEDRIESFLI